jgi:hypothetical protein
MTPLASGIALSGAFYRWPSPTPDAVGATAVEFLQRLPGPTHIHIPGKDSSRCRAVVTLLHGNEPSGLFALHAVLRQGIRPCVDLHCFVMNVDAAKQAPGFVYRMLPHHKDLNRCFQSPHGDSDEEQLAAALLTELHKLQPEALIDIHNTSGSSPPFGVTTFMDARHDALVSLFTHRMIVTDLTLGALMEISEEMMPTVTIECGGAQDRESNLVATEGLIRYMTLESVLEIEHSEVTLEFFHNPMRMELQDGSDIAYGDHSLMPDGVTLLPDIENSNFGFVDSSKLLGFVSGDLHKALRARHPDGSDCLDDFFQLRNEKLYPRKKLKLFMVTTNPEIARKDCLFYFVEAESE